MQRRNAIRAREWAWGRAALGLAECYLALQPSIADPRWRIRGFTTGGDDRFKIPNSACQEQDHPNPIMGDRHVLGGAHGKRGQRPAFVVAKLAFEYLGREPIDQGS